MKRNNRETRSLFGRQIGQMAMVPGLVVVRDQRAGAWGTGALSTRGRHPESPTMLYSLTT